jgi:hypothetical protein
LAPTLPRPSGEREGVRGRSAEAVAIAYFALGKLKSAPDLMPAGQRVVTVLRRV